MSLKLQLPKFLTPRRKYEVNESMSLVKFGRSRLLPALRLTRRILMRLGRELVVFGHSSAVVLNRQARNIVLFFQWRKIPKSWELSFESKMKSAESQGIPFAEVLQTNLPLVLGDAPSEVLLRWVGRKARSQPRQFAKNVSKMFGPSGKRIITGLEERYRPEEMLEVHEEPEEPFQALIDAIEKADATKSNPVKFLDKDRWKNFST